MKWLLEFQTTATMRAHQVIEATSLEDAEAAAALICDQAYRRDDTYLDFDVEEVDLSDVDVIGIRKLRDLVTQTNEGRDG